MRSPLLTLLIGFATLCFTSLCFAGQTRPVQSAGISAGVSPGVSDTSPDPFAHIITAATWSGIAPGLEVGMYYPPNIPGGELRVVRIDPAAYVFRVHYRPREALSLEGWRASLPDAVGIVNASFFTPDLTADGLLVADGTPYGSAWAERGGIFRVQEGAIRIRATSRDPYQGEMLEQAVQGFPMLVANGTAMLMRRGFTDRQTRRTVAAQDREGRILLIGTPASGVALADLSYFLTRTDLDIVDAVNFDGGSSSFFWLDAGDAPPIEIESSAPVPSVLAVYRAEPVPPAGVGSPD